MQLSQAHFRKLHSLLQPRLNALFGTAKIQL
jgi:hypothetical protein